MTTSTGINRLDIVANASGEYSCTPPSTGFGNEPAVVMPAAESCQRRHP